MDRIKEERNRFIRNGLLTMSVVFIITGIVKQEYLEVLQKAVKICLECIGIG